MHIIVELQIINSSLRADEHHFVIWYTVKIGESGITMGKKKSFLRDSSLSKYNCMIFFTTGLWNLFVIARFCFHTFYCMIKIFSLTVFLIIVGVFVRILHFTFKQDQLLILICTNVYLLIF